MEQYVATGQVVLEYRDFTILGEESEQAAEAAACAADQGEFWRYHDTLYANQGDEQSGAYADDRLKQMAAELGLDESTFNSCLDSGEHADEVAAMAEEARAGGISVTPSFVLNGEVRRWQGWDELKGAIDAALGATS